MQAMMITIGGSVGAGKTTLAYRLKEFLETTYGRTCHVMEDDTERRLYLGYSLKDPMRGNEYLDEISKAVYDIMQAKTKQHLADGCCVIRTAVRQSDAAYQEENQLAEENNADFIGIFLQASKENILSRINSRNREKDETAELSLERGHASDVDEGILLKLPIPSFYPNGWLVIDANQKSEIVLERAITLLEKKL